MKKLLIVLLALMFSTTVYAATTQDCVISVEVASTFELTIDRSFIGFGSITGTPGPVISGESTADETLLINTLSTTGSDWQLLFSSSPLTNGTDVIANTNTYVRLDKDGAAAGISPYAGGGNLPGAETVLYPSGLGETGNLWHGAVFSVSVPLGQTAGDGSYTSTITFTMVEI